jgi:predicted nucleotidyltransferase
VKWYQLGYPQTRNTISSLSTKIFEWVFASIERGKLCTRSEKDPLGQMKVPKQYIEEFMKPFKFENLEQMVAELEPFKVQRQHKGMAI